MVILGAWVLLNTFLFGFPNCLGWQRDRAVDGSKKIDGFYKANRFVDDNQGCFWEPRESPREIPQQSKYRTHLGKPGIAW